MSATIDQLMDAAENGIRLHGYHAVSFRDLADELGIKSSSVHYYFRHKEDLGLALVRRYSERFFAALNAKTANAKTPEARLRAFCDVYRNALVGSDRICLCGMLGAEGCGLPQTLGDAVASFFSANIDWLVDALPKEVHQRRKRATHIVATLQGAMILASSMKNPKIFDDAVTSLLVGSS